MKVVFFCLTTWHLMAMEAGRRAARTKRTFMAKRRGGGLLAEVRSGADWPWYL